MGNYGDNHPRGTCLLARDNPQNRKQWGDNFPFGYEDVAETVCTDDHQCPHYRQQQQQDGTVRDDTTTPIHLLIAAYRDKLCSRTLHNLFTRAAHPERLWVRVLDQTDPNSDLQDDVGCWKGYCERYNSNCETYEHQVLTIHVDANKAKGPTDARSKLSALVYWDYVHRHADAEENQDNKDNNSLELHPVQESDFCMQTDSHMDFHTDFDVKLIQMFHRAQNEYAVLSTYVAAMEQNNQDPHDVPHLCMATFTSSIRNWGTKECKWLRKPKLTNAMWGAGLSFHRCHAELVVPVDPYLDNVFDGEEGSRGIRFFTHGYDVYTPDQVLVTHDYVGHQHNPVVHTWGRKRNQNTFPDRFRWNEHIERERDKLTTLGSERVNKLLGIGIHEESLTPGELEELHLIRASRFGLGSKRTLEQAASFTGMDLPNRRMATNRCGNLQWVPFTETLNNGVDDALARPLAPTSRDELMVVARKDAPTAAAKEQPPPFVPVAADPKTQTDPFLERATTYELVAGILLMGVLLSVRGRFRRNKGQRHKN